jgi:hypothetical protein
MASLIDKGPAVWHRPAWAIPAAMLNAKTILDRSLRETGMDLASSEKYYITM